MSKPTLKLIRNSEALKAAISQNDSDFAAACSLLKWSPKNRKWLSQDVDRVIKACGLCCYHRECKTCPIYLDGEPCFGRWDFKQSRYAANYEKIKEFHKSAEAFHCYLKGVLEK